MSITRTLRYLRRYRNWRELSRFRSRGEDPSEVELRNGLRFSSPANTNVLRAAAGVFFKRYYSPRGFEIGPEDCVVDVGANFGAFSVYAGVRTRGTVLAVEPHPENLRFLEGNLAANACLHVRVVPLALADRTGVVDLHPGRTGTTHQLFAEGPDASGAPPLRVQTTTLPELLEKYSVSSVSLLKMDCEGAEGLILPATPRSVLERIDRVAMEYHDDVSPLNREELAELLGSVGFRVRIEARSGRSNGMLFASRLQ